MSSRIFGLRLSLFNAVLFLGSGIQLPFLPLWLKDKALSEGEIALVVAMMMAVRILAIPVGTFVADLTGSRRIIIIVSAFGTFAAYLLLHFMNGFVPILIVGMLAAAMLAPIAPLTEVLAIEGSAHFGIDYGRIRLWASLSFLAGSLIAGALLEVIPVHSVILLIAAAQGLGALVTLVLPHDGALRLGEQTPTSLPAVFAVALSAVFVIFMAAASIGQSSHGLLYAFGSVYYDDLGFSKLTIGELWAVSVTFEILMFAFSGVFYKRFGSVTLIAIGTGCGILRWFVMGLEPPLAMMFVISALHAGSFGLTHLGTMHFIRENVPDNMRNSMQGLFSVLSSGILMSATMWSSGPLYGLMGGKAYFVMASYSAIAFALALILRRVSPRVH
jgi:PPP family 3-phenylpropionic acid transporter